MRSQIKEIIRFHRKRSGLTQRELAELAGGVKIWSMNWKTANWAYGLDNLLKVLLVLNIKLDFQSPLHDAFMKEHLDAEGWCIFPESPCRWKNNLTRRDLVEHFGRNRLQLTEKVIDKVLMELKQARPTWEKLLAGSFLSAGMKKKFVGVVDDRFKRLF